MEDFIVGMICLCIMGGIGIYLGYKNDALKDSAYKERQRHAAEIQRLESQIASAAVYRSELEAEANRLFDEQIAMKLEAIDAGKAMLREAMKHQNNNRM